MLRQQLPEEGSRARPRPPRFPLASEVPARRFTAQQMVTSKWSFREIILLVLASRSKRGSKPGIYGGAKEDQYQYDSRCCYQKTRK